MNDVKWIKITTDIFDDEKILLIESMPAADSIITIWFKLLTLAGKQNNSGVFLLNDKIAYTDEMLSTIFRRDINTVRLALNTFEKFEMIEIVNGVITIPNWGKHQNLDKIEAKSEYMRNYMRGYRQKQQKITCKTNGKSNSKANVSEAEEEIDKDKDNISVSKDTDCRTEVQRAVEKWNSLSSVGIKSISKLSSSSKRYQSLVARINEYGIDAVLRAIDKAGNSDFLKGHNKKGWSITFDWFVLPNNFPKVLEGNYDNAGCAEENAPKPKEDEPNSGSPIERLPAEFADRLRSQGMVDDEGDIFYTMLSAEDLEEVRKGGLLV